MQAASDTWINPTAATTADFQLQTGTAGSTCPVSTAAAPAQGAGGGLSMPLPPSNSMAPPSVTPASGAAQAGLQEGTLTMPMGPVERQGSLADLLFEILDDGDTDDLLLAEITKQDKSAADAGSQILLQQAQQQPPLLQQLQHRRLLERLQASKQQQQQQQVDFDPFAIRDPSNATSSSLAASLAGTAGSTPWPSFTSAPGQAGPGAAALFGGADASAPTANAAAQDAGTALMQQLQLRAQGLQTSLPALKAAAGVAEGALLERQAMKKQLLQQLQQQQQQRQDQQAAADTSMAAAGAQDGQQQRDAGAAAAAGAGNQQQQAQTMQTEPAADTAAGDAAACAAGASAAGAAAGVGGSSSAATAAALLAEAGDDLNLDLDFLEAMLQDSNGGEFKVMGDLARMVSLPVTGDTTASPLLYQQQQQQLRPQQQHGTGAPCTSLAEDMSRAGLMQPPPPQMQQQQQQGAQVQNQAGAFAAAAASGGGLLSPAAAGAGALAGAGGMQPDPAISMDSGMRSAMKHLGRLQIPSPSGDLGLASFQNPVSVDASRPGMDQGSLVGARGGLLMGPASGQNPLRQLQQQAGFGALAGSSAKPPLPASSSRSGVGPSNSVPDESNGSVELGAAEAMSDGEVEQSASGRRSSARRRSRLALAKHKRQQQKAQQPAASAGGGAGAVAVGRGVPQKPNISQPQVVPGGMLQLLLSGGNGNSSMGFAAASCQMQQMDLQQQQQQQMLLQSYGSAPNPSFDGPLSPPMLGTAASTGHMGLPSPAGSTLSADPIQSIPRKQLTAVLATLAPNALQQLLMLQQRQPALARVVLKRALQQLQHQTEMGVQHQGLESLLGAIGGMDTSAQLASPTPSAAAAAGAPSVFKPRQTSSKGADVPNGQSSRRNKAPLVFYRQRGSKAMTNMGGKQGTQQTQRAGSAPLLDPKQELMSPQAAAGMGMGGFDAAQLQQLDPAMAAALCAPSGAPSGAAAVAGSVDGGQPGSMSSSDIASSDGAPPAPHQQQQPSSGSRRAGLGKRARQITQNDLSGAVAAATAGGSGNPLDASNGTLPTPQSSGALPFIPMQPAQLQLQLQHGLNEAMQFGRDEAPRAEHASGGLAALFGPNASTATGSMSSAGGAADAAVITQQARALVRILTKLNTQQLIQTRTMLHSVLQRSAPGLLDHMGAIERMINQLINLKQQQPMLPQQQQQHLLMQGAFGAGGGMFAAGGGGGMNMGFGLEDSLMGQQQQQQQGQAQMQANVLQQQVQQQVQQQQQQHMISWPNDPFVQHQLQPTQGQSQQQQQQQQLLQSQMQGQLQQQSPWGIATSLSGPQPLQWNAQQQPDGSAAAAAAAGAGAAPAGRTGGEDDTDQTPYQLATRRQQGRRTKAKPDKQQRQQQQQQAAAAAAAAGLQMASSAPASLPQAAGANAMQQQQQLSMLPDMQQQQQQQQRLQQLQQQQLHMQQQQGMGMGVSQAMQQQQQQQSMAGNGAAGGAAGGDGLLLDAAQERQQEDMLLSWLQNDAIEDWPEGQDMLGVLSG